MEDAEFVPGDAIADGLGGEVVDDEVFAVAEGADVLCVGYLGEREEEEGEAGGPPTQEKGGGRGVKAHTSWRCRDRMWMQV